jgi:hypothetical protein
MEALLLQCVSPLLALSRRAKAVQQQSSSLCWGSHAASRLGLTFQPTVVAMEGPFRGPVGEAPVATERDQEKANRVTETTCPKCGSRLAVSRVANAPIDSEGREGYFIQCRECGTWLAGTIDPGDEVFLPL